MATPTSPAELTTLLPGKHEWDSGEAGRAIGFTSPDVHRKHRHHHRHRRRSSLRKDIWTILRFRSSIRHRSSLQRASYAFEVCILTLIVLNVLVAMGISSLIDGETPEVACSSSLALTHPCMRLCCLGVTDGVV